MAKKIVASAESSDIRDVRRPKKGRHKCCTCCLVFLIVILIIFAGAFGVGWYFGDMYTQEYLDMSLADTLGVVFDLYWTDDSDVVVNPYSDKDLAAFYVEVKRNVLLKDDADIDFDGALTKALEDYLGADGGAEQGSLNAARSSDEDGEEEDGSIIGIFVDMIANVMNRENIDMERLYAYDHLNAETDEYIFNLNDRQIASFINSVLKTILKNASRLESMSGVSDIVDLSEVVALKQIRFLAQNGKNDAGESVVTATTADVTVWLGLQDAASQAIEYFLTEAGVGWASGFVGWLGDVILPENVYITLSIPMYGDAEPKINLNDMDADEQARMYKLVNGILRLTGSEDTITDILVGFTDQIKPFLEAAGENMPLHEVKNGTITMDLLGALTEMASEGMEGEPLTKADYIYVLQALLSDPKTQLDAIQPYRYQNMYIDENGREVYVEGPVSDKLTPINYKRKFAEEIEDKYSVNLNLDEVEDPNLTDVLSRLGLSFGDDSASGNVLGIIDAQRFHASLNRNRADLEIMVTDRMLAALLSDQLDGMLTGGGSGFEDLDVVLDALTFLRKSDASGAQNGHEYALLAVEINLTGMFDTFDDQSLITKIASGIMPERVVLTMTVDITKSLPAGQSKDPVEFVLNACDNTDRALAAIGKLAPELDLHLMAERIESMLNDMLDEMYKKINIRLVASTMAYDSAAQEWTGEAGGMAMPDLFSVIVDTALFDANADDGNGGTGKRVVEPDTLQAVLLGLSDTGAFPTDPIVAENYQGFLDQVIDKYYLDTSDLAEGEQIDSFTALTSFITDFDNGKFRINSGNPDPQVKYLAYDTRPINDPRENHKYDLKPFMTDKELGALLVEKMAADDNVRSYTIMDVTVTADSFAMLLSIESGTILTDEVRFMLDTDKVYVTVTANLDEILTDENDMPYAYDVDVTINSMNDETYQATLDIVGFLSGFSIENQVKDFGKILYEQLSALTNSVNGEESNGGTFEFTDGGLVMTDFYTFLSNKMGIRLDETKTAETVKAAMQGMYSKPAVAELANNANNYVLNTDILRNPAGDQKPWTNEEYSSFISDGGTKSDIAMNALLKRDVEAFGGNDVKVLQTIILAANDDAESTEQKRQEVLTWAGARIEGGLSSDKDYMLITFEMAMGSFASHEGKGESAVILPETVYATVVYEMTDDESTPFSQVGVIFNNMTSVEYGIIGSAMGLQTQADPNDPNKVNIGSVAGKSAEVLNAMALFGQIELGGQTDGEGVGSFTLTPRSLL